MSESTGEKTLFSILVFMILGSSLAAFLSTLLFLKVAWPWVIPAIAPDAVARGLIVSSLSWLDAFRIAVVMGIWKGITKDAVIGAAERWMGQD